ncbi:MAG: hypothetical protein WCC10_12655, partial [Tumebacillaceae bacterium]
AETLHAEAGGTPERAAVERKTSMWSNYLRVFRDRKFMFYIFATLLTLSVERNLTNYIGIRLSDEMQGVPWLPWLQSQVNGLEMLGILRTENTLVCVLIPLLIGRWLNGNSGARTMFIAMAVNIIGYTYLSFGNQPSLLLLIMLVAAVGEIVYIPIKQALLVNIVPDDSRSSYMAVNSMAVRGSHILAGVNVMLGGYLSSGSMATLIGLTGIAGVFLLILIAPSLEKVQPAVGKSQAM